MDDPADPSDIASLWAATGTATAHLVLGRDRKVRELRVSGVDAMTVSSGKAKRGRGREPFLPGPARPERAG